MTVAARSMSLRLSVRDRFAATSPRSATSGRSRWLAADVIVHERCCLLIFLLQTRRRSIHLAAVPRTNTKARAAGMTAAENSRRREYTGRWPASTFGGRFLPPASTIRPVRASPLQEIAITNSSGAES
jgi:hypothetical protein